VDYLYPFEGKLIPIAVKPGKEGKLHSLHLFMQQATHIMALRFYSGKIKISPVTTREGKTYQLLSLPYYLVSQLDKYLLWFKEEIQRNQVIEKQGEMPPYILYKNYNGIKDESRSKMLDESVTALRLKSVLLSPIEIKRALSLRITVHSNTETKDHLFEVAKLGHFPNQPNHLFFIKDADQFIDIALPKGRKWISIKVECATEVKQFDLRLACVYV
jgi:hypothetical protein